jgi:hypothetical protein
MRMKPWSMLFVLTASFFAAASVHGGTFKPEDYKETEVKALKLQIEDYRNKKVCYVGVYHNTKTTFPPYADRSGIKAGKFFWLIITPNNLPVIARKGKKLDDAIMALKRGSKVKVYGKVRKLKYKPKRTMLPRYYLELIHLEVVKEAEKPWKKNKKNRREVIPPPAPPE